MNETEIVNNVARSGTQSLKFYNYFESIDKGYRNEINPLVDLDHVLLTIGEENWIGFSIYLPVGYVCDGCDPPSYAQESHFQMMGIPDAHLGEDYTRYPNFALIIDGDHWLINILGDSNPVLDHPIYERQVSYDLVNEKWTEETGQWTDFVIHTKLDYNLDGDGFLKVYKNGILIVDDSGSNCLNDVAGVKTQMGNYKFSWRKGPTDVESRTMYMDEIRIGNANSSYAEVSPDSSNLCDGVVCDNICIGNDLWSQKCVDGICVADTIIEINSSTCGYDPCDGVVCDNICVGNDLWSRKCVDGSCVPDQLIESNSISCGYDPCEGVVCDNVCIGKDLWSRKCVDGSCVPDQLIESNSVTCELCEGVVCGNICVGNDLWSQRCDPDTGTCVANQLLQLDSINCKIPDQVPSDESTINTYIILGGFGLMGLAMLILRKK